MTNDVPFYRRKHRSSKPNLGDNTANSGANSSGSVQDHESNKETLSPPVSSSPSSTMRKLESKTVAVESLYTKSLTKCHEEGQQPREEIAVIRTNSQSHALIPEDDSSPLAMENKISPTDSRRGSVGVGDKTQSEMRHQQHAILNTSLLSKSADNLDRFDFSDHPGEEVRLHNESDLVNHDKKTFLRFEIEDAGIGMSDEAMASLFNAFKQTQRLAGGTGLGLYSLAKRMEAMNGRYGVMRRRDGLQGSLFWFSIPYRPDETFAEVAKKEAEATPDVSSSNVIGTIVIPMGSSFSMPSSSPPLCSLRVSPSVDALQKLENQKPVVVHLSSRSTDQVHVPLVPSAIVNPPSGMPSSTSTNNGNKGLKILLVDDSPSIIKMTGMMLKRMGHQLSTAENGALAVKLVAENYKKTKIPFHAILMDLQMPVMDGLEATRRIREFEKRLSQDNTDPIHHLVVGMSANSDTDTMEEAYAASIDIFMPKPFNMETFNSKVISKINSSASQLSLSVGSSIDGPPVVLPTLAEASSSPLASAQLNSFLLPSL
jgi:CheY-like chemotaxis protein